MRIKIIGDNNCARATRHLLRLGGFAVTEFLPADALAGGPLAGYAITIDLAPATHSPDAHLRPDSPTLHARPSSEEADRIGWDASSPSFANGTAGEPSFAEVAAGESVVVGKPFAVKSSSAQVPAEESLSSSTTVGEKTQEADAFAVTPKQLRSGGSGIHFDSVDSELEAAVLRHVTQLAAAPVVVDRPGGVVHSDRELRIVVPNTGDAVADDAAAVAVEFGILRGLLDLSAGTGRRGQPTSDGAYRGDAAEGSNRDGSVSRRIARIRKWWPFAVILFFVSVGIFPVRFASRAAWLRNLQKGHRLKPVLLEAGAFSLAQGQFDTGQGLKITDGSNFLVVDPCMGSAKLFASINQTANTQLAGGTASRKIYVCSIHVVAAAAANVAVVEGTGSVCGTGTAGVSGFGGATAATGWNFAANGGIALGNGASSLGAEGTSGDNLCLFSSGSAQVSGGISYVVQ
jgi:hypothetical protein